MTDSRYNPFRYGLFFVSSRASYSVNASRLSKSWWICSPRSYRCRMTSILAQLPGLHPVGSDGSFVGVLGSSLSAFGGAGFGNGLGRGAFLRDFFGRVEILAKSNLPIQLRHAATLPDFGADAFVSIASIRPRSSARSVIGARAPRIALDAFRRVDGS